MSNSLNNNWASDTRATAKSIPSKEIADSRDYGYAKLLNTANTEYGKKKSKQGSNPQAAIEPKTGSTGSKKIGSEKPNTSYQFENKTGGYSNNGETSYTGSLSGSDNSGSNNRGSDRSYTKPPSKSELKPSLNYTACRGGINSGSDNSGSENNESNSSSSIIYYPEDAYAKLTSKEPDMAQALYTPENQEIFERNLPPHIFKQYDDRRKRAGGK